MLAQLKLKLKQESPGLDFVLVDEQSPYPVGRGEAGEGGRLYLGGGRSFRQTAALARRASERGHRFICMRRRGNPLENGNGKGPYFMIHIRSVDSYSAAMRDMAGSTARVRN